MPSLYPRILGDSWSELPECLRQCFDVREELRASGVFRVHRGNRSFARFLARIARLPQAGEEVEVSLVVTPDRNGETWKRRFGTDEFVTRQWEENGLLTERAGVLELRFRLAVSDGRLTFQQEEARLRVVGARIPLPRWLSPQVSACAWENERMQVSVEVTFPGVGLLCRYEGGLVQREAAR